MSPSSYITGTGLASALGADLPTTWDALMDGQYIVTHAAAKLTVADPSISRVGALATQAANEAITSAGWSRERLLDSSTAIVFGTSKGDITDWFGTSATSDKTNAVAGWTEGCFGVARACHELCDRLGRPAGPRITISAACASGLQALIRANLMLRAGAAERALVVAAEASIHPLFLASFDRLGVLAGSAEPGRPFDLRRNGFRMSEAAAAVTLERSSTPHCSTDLAITFTGMAGDASHVVAGDPNARVLSYLLDKAFLQTPIDIIHAHGTGTLLNDQLESAAIEAAIAKAGVNGPYLFSHKGVLGHSLGASGLVSVVLAHAIHRRGQLIAMATTTVPIPLRYSTLVHSNERIKIRTSLTLASGFGGAQTAVILRSV